MNMSNDTQFADIVSGQHMLPSWYHTSVDAVPKHGTSSLHSRNRWQTQMAFSKSVYSFEVKEDTVPGVWPVQGGLPYNSEAQIHNNVDDNSSFGVLKCSV